MDVMSQSVDDFVQLGVRNSVSGSSINSTSDGGSIMAEVETVPPDSDLLRILECPVCTEFPAPPIYNCANGHFTCNDCITVLDKCTLCQSAFTKVRNYALESIIEKTKFKCRYASQGCLEAATGAAYKEHLDMCQYGPLVCNETYFTTCEGTAIEPNEYLEHLFSFHDASGKSIQSKNILSGNFEQKKSDHFSPIYLKSELNGSNGPTFVLKTKKHKSFICWWVVCLDPSETTNYSTKLTWTTKKQREDNTAVTEPPTNAESLPSAPANGIKDSGNHSLQWTLPIHNVKKPFDEIRDSGLCAVLPLTHIAPFVTDSEGEIGWKILFEIQRIEQTEEIPMITENENPLKQLVEHLRYYFPLIALLFMVIAVALLCAIYLKANVAGNTSTTERKGELGSGSGAWEMNDDYYGYRGFYYHDHENDRLNDLPEPGSGRREKRERRKGKPNKRNSDPSDDEFVGYRGFYHSKNEEPTQQQQPQQPNNIPMKILSKLSNLVSYSLGEFFGVKNRLDKTLNKAYEKGSKLGYESDEQNFIGKFVAKFFMLCFSFFSVLTVLISLAMYKRWLWNNPTGTRRNEPGNQNGNDNSNENENGNAWSGVRRPRPPRDRNMFRGPVNRFRSIDPLF